MNGVTPRGVRCRHEPFHTVAALIYMTPGMRRMAAGLPLVGLLLCAPLAAEEFAFTDAELRSVEAGRIIVRARLDAAQRRGMVRAAVRIEAPPALVFRMMTSCADALEYVPHLELCRVRDSAPDGSWQLVEHEVDFGWYAPRVRYVFRADLTADRRIDFRQVSGDFKVNEGVWSFETAGDGTHTLLKYRATIDPPGHIPNWLARSTFKRELPQMLGDLRTRCEDAQTLRVEAVVAPD
jgi:ribosome-associated toxin RatA of RatAB toxin-antitoxin module